MTAVQLAVPEPEKEQQGDEADEENGRGRE
jgi:hypothetical protein